MITNGLLRAHELRVQHQSDQHTEIKATNKTEQNAIRASDFREDAVVAIFETHEGAERAIKALEKDGFDMKKLSIVGRDFHSEEHAMGFYTSGDRMKFWGSRGAFWGTLWGMLFGSAFFFIPAVGPLVVMGPLVLWVVGALEGAVVGTAAGVLGAALTSVGIPKDSVIKYETDVKAGKFLVIANGTADTVERARSIMKTTSPSCLNAHVIAS